MATFTIPLPEEGQRIEHQYSHPKAPLEAALALPAAFPHSFSRRLLFRLLKRPEKDKRVLRALEYLFFRVLTQKGSGHYRRRLRPEKVIDGLLEQYKIPAATRIGRQAAERYHGLIEEALSTRNAIELQEKKLLEQARTVKYDLDRHYLGREVIKASVECLILFERLYQTPGYVAPDRFPDKTTPLYRLPLEPHPKLATPSSESRGTAFSWEQIEGGLSNSSQATQAPEEGHAVASSRPNALESGPQKKEAPLPVTLDGVAVAKMPREVPTPPWEHPGAELRQTAKIRVSRKRSARRSTRRIRKEESTPARKDFVHRFLGTYLKGVIALSLAVIVFGGGSILLRQAPEVLVRPDHYQAYYFADPGLEALFPSARRVKRTMILTASDQWKQLDFIGQHARVARLARNLLEEDGFDEILVLDALGNTLARARGARIEVLAGIDDKVAAVPPRK